MAKRDWTHWSNAPLVDEVRENLTKANGFVPIADLRVGGNSSFTVAILKHLEALGEVEILRTEKRNLYRKKEKEG